MSHRHHTHSSKVHAMIFIGQGIAGVKISTTNPQTSGSWMEIEAVGICLPPLPPFPLCACDNFRNGLTTDHLGEEVPSLPHVHPHDGMRDLCDAHSCPSSLCPQPLNQQPLEQFGSRCSLASHVSLAYWLASERRHVRGQRPMASVGRRLGARFHRAPIFPSRMRVATLTASVALCRMPRPPSRCVRAMCTKTGRPRAMSTASA